MPSNHLILCYLLLLPPSIFLSISVFSNELVLQIRWPKYWSFCFSISPSNEYSELISFKMNWLDLLASKRLSRVFSNTTVQKHQLFGTQFSSVQSVSRVRLFATPSTAARQASLSITNSHSSLKLTSIESVMPSNHLILSSPFPPAPNPSQHQSLFQWVNSSHEVAKVLEFQL